MRKKEPIVNKQLILDAASELGAEEGWQQVTFRAIANRTGISKGGIIHHFPSKENLLAELMRQSLEELSDWIKQEIKSPRDEDSSLAYLRFIIQKSEDIKYRRTMKIIMRVIMIDERYLKIWDKWFTENVSGGSNSDISSVIIRLVADGLWYSDNLGLYGHEMKTKLNILAQLSKSK